MSEKLGNFLREVSNWKWDEFVKAEHDSSYTSNQAMIFALVRSCAMQNLAAIKLSVNRLDGKLVTPIKVEYPKIFYLFPNAKPPQEGAVSVEDRARTREVDAATASTGSVDPAGAESKSSLSGEVLALEVVEPEVVENDLPSLSLRQTVAKMADYPRELPANIINLALQTEQSLRKMAARPPEPDIPFVKSVVAAHLLTLAQNRHVDALSEVFDEIDGKLAETFKLLGDDIFITSYAVTAPDGAYLNDDGVMQLEASAVQDMWAQKLAQ